MGAVEQDPTYERVAESMTLASQDVARALGRRNRPEATHEGLPVFYGCRDCMAYSARRSTVMNPAVRVQADREGVPAAVVAHRLLSGVHARHQKGLPL